MLETNDSHTAHPPKAEIMKITRDFGVGIDQTFSITTENGLNFIKAAELLKKAQQLYLYILLSSSEHAVQ